MNRELFFGHLADKWQQNGVQKALSHRPIDAIYSVYLKIYTTKYRYIQ